MSDKTEEKTESMSGYRLLIALFAFWVVFSILRDIFVENMPVIEAVIDNGYYLLMGLILGVYSSILIEKRELDRDKEEGCYVSD